MRLCARVFLHSIGEMHNPRQLQDVLLLRVRLAAVLAQLQAEASQTTIPFPPNDEAKAEACDGLEEATLCTELESEDDIPF